MTFRLASLEQKWKHVVPRYRPRYKNINLLWFLYSSRLLMIAGYWRTRMTNFFIIFVLNWQNENGKIRER